jgi:hypothetical protein
MLTYLFKADNCVLFMMLIVSQIMTMLISVYTIYVTGSFIGMFMLTINPGSAFLSSTLES